MSDSDDVIPFSSKFGYLVGEEENFDWVELEDRIDIEAEIADLKEREKESTGVDPATCQRIRAEALCRHLFGLYGIRIGPTDLMTALMYSGVKLAVDSLGHVQSGYDSLKYDAGSEEVPDLEKYRIAKRIKH